MKLKKNKIFLIVLITAIILGVVGVSGCIGDSSVNVTINDNGTNDNSTDKGECQIKIETDGKWRLDASLDSNYRSDEGTGDKTVDVGTLSQSASITVNQYSGGPTKVSLIDSDGNVLHEESSAKTGTDTIYFYYTP